MLIQTRKGVYCSNKKIIVAKTGERKSKKHLHGFLNGQRIYGFWYGIRKNILPYSFDISLEHRHCERCLDTVGHLKLHI